MSRVFSWRVLILFVLVAVGILALIFSRQYLLQFIDWVKEQGIWGPLILGIAYVVATVLLIPGSLMTIGAGFAFDMVTGVITVSIASTLGATAAFLVGRTVARGLIEEKVKNNPRFHSLDNAVAEQGFFIVLLTRLSPVFPFVWLNYFFGLTRVPLWKYMLASWLGMLPGGIMFVYIGSTLQNLAAVSAGDKATTPGEQILFIIGLVATVIVTVFVTRLARQALNKAAPDISPASQGSSHEPTS